MLLIISAICFGCKSDKDKKPPTIVTEYIDVENLWNMYYKDLQTVKDSLTAGVFVSEKDVQRTPDWPILKVLTYSKDTPGGRFIIECIFYRGMLIEIHVVPEKITSISELLPHYLAITNDINNLTNNNPGAFPFKADHSSDVIFAKSMDEISNDNAHKKFYGIGARDEYAKYLGECVNNYMSTNEDSCYFATLSSWNERMYDPVIGCPNDVDPNGISKCFSTYFGSYEFSKFEAQMMILILSKYSNVGIE